MTARTRILIPFLACALAACGGNKNANGASAVGDDGLPKPDAASGSVTGMPNPGESTPEPVGQPVLQEPASPGIDDVPGGTTPPADIDVGNPEPGADAAVEVVRVPGSWEIPLTLRTLAAQRRHDALIALSAVIRGDTPHFDYVAGEAAKGVAQASADSGIPIAFGILTTNTVDQAIDRAGAKSGNKGFDAAMTAIEMANLLRRLRESSK